MTYNISVTRFSVGITSYSVRIIQWNLHLDTTSLVLSDITWNAFYIGDRFFKYLKYLSWVCTIIKYMPEGVGWGGLTMDIQGILQYVLPKCKVSFQRYEGTRSLS